MMLDEQTVYRHLKTLGMPAHLKGYHYIKAALMYVSRIPLSTIRMTYVYDHVGTLVKATHTQVERCMRNSIEYVFQHTNSTILKEYFGNAINYNSGKVTNQQFLCDIVEYINCHEKSVSTPIKNFDK